MRLALIVLLLLVGCAHTRSVARIQPIEVGTRSGPIASCYVHGQDDTTFADTRLVDMQGRWAITGVIQEGHCAAGHRCRVKVEAVDADEYLVLATLSPMAVGNLDGWTFYLPIPGPIRFHHLHLAIVGSEHAYHDLPPHGSRLD